METSGYKFMKDGCKWEVLAYDDMENNYVCHNLDSNHCILKKFKESEMEDK